MLGLLEGKLVNLRSRERDDVDFLYECGRIIDFWGEYAPVPEQISKAEYNKAFDNPSNLTILTESKWFIVEKKDGTKIGLMNHRLILPNKWMEISYALMPNERGKGYGTEAVQLMVDYLFLSKDLVRIQAMVDLRNKASQRVLEKAGFQREGTIRKSFFIKCVWVDSNIYSILREEWKEPKILTKTT